MLERNRLPLEEVDIADIQCPHPSERSGGLLSEAELDLPHTTRASLEGTWARYMT